MKEEKFRTLVEKRVNSAIKQIRLIGNLSNRQSYEYTEEQIRKVFKALETEVADAKLRFSPKSPAETNRAFSL